jgi:hypothetical protein
MRTLFKLAIVATMLGLGAACAPPPYGPPNYHAVSGALVGAAAGAVIGHEIHPTGGAATGALAGALIGGAIGNNMDWQAQGYYYDERPYDRYDDGYGYVPPPPWGYYNPPPRYYAPPRGDGYGYR